MKLWILLLCGCTTIAAGGQGTDGGAGDDPLAIPDEAPAGSLDQIHRQIFAKSCAGQPGLCHAGQFPPSLATPATAYTTIVRRPATEREHALRVAPGDPDASLFIDKLRGRNVATRMPLGAEPLPEAEIALIETWIRDGALRRPGAAPAPTLNNPPSPPEIAVFDATGKRLDTTGPFRVAVGDELIFRQSVRDFETADSDIPGAVFTLNTIDGQTVILTPGADDPTLGTATYDPMAPMGTGDRLDWQYTWLVPDTVSLRDPGGMFVTSRPSSGLILSLAASYLDSLPFETAILAVSERPGLLVIE